MRPEELRGHILALSREHRIPLLEIMAGKEHVLPPSYQSGVMMRRGGMQMVCVPSIKDEVSYGTALHEFGHILGEDQGTQRSTPFDILCEEAGAWVWARQTAWVWSDRMRLDMQTALRSYLLHARRNTLSTARHLVSHGNRYHGQPRLLYPPPGHSLWSLVGWTEKDVEYYVQSGELPL